MLRLNFARTLAAAALAAPALPAAAQSSLVTLHVGTSAADDVTPILWAKTTGMFAKAGLDVDIQKLTSGSAVTSAVIGGTLDVGRSSLLPLISARNHGVPIQLVAPAQVSIGEDPSSGIIVMKDSPVKTGRDLNGMTVPRRRCAITSMCRRGRGSMRTAAIRRRSNTSSCRSPPTSRPWKRDASPRPHFRIRFSQRPRERQSATDRPSERRDRKAVPDYRMVRYRSGDRAEARCAGEVRASDASGDAPSRTRIRRKPSRSFPNSGASTRRSLQVWRVHRRRSRSMRKISSR